MKTRFAPTALAVAMLAPAAAWSQVTISIGIAPPPLPVYSQPPVPGDGYLWTPGYWAWDAQDNDYFWVPGTWVLAPTPGYLWTPGYWSYNSGGYAWNSGYWGPSVGFYGGIDYGHGYTGHGYEGGRWEHGAFHYNTAVNNVNTTVVHNVYNTRVVNETVNVRRVSYNGGATGVHAKPTAAEERVRQEKHIAATPSQIEHERAAMKEPEQRAAVNHGAPKIAATSSAGAEHDDRGGNAANGDKTATHTASGTESHAAPKPEKSRAAQMSSGERAAPQARAGEPHAKPESREPQPHQMAAKPTPSEPSAKSREAPHAADAHASAEAKSHGNSHAGQSTSHARAPAGEEEGSKRRE